jgi:hypothetical protein
MLPYGYICCDSLTIADANYGSNAKVNINGSLTVNGTFTVTGTLLFKNSDGTIYDILPIGSIMMWWNTTAIDIPTGWALIDATATIDTYIVAGDGSAGQSTEPALADKFKNQGCVVTDWGLLGVSRTGCCSSDVNMSTTKVNFIIRVS